MRFLLDIVVPLMVAGISIGIISTLITSLLRIIHFDVTIVKIILFFVAWYYVGPIIYNFLLDKIIVNQNDILEFIYKPAQAIMEALKI